MNDLVPPKLAFALEVRVKVAPTHILRSGGMTRRVVPILEGTFEGPGLKGTVMSGGADWQMVREDGTTELDARYRLRTDDGAVIVIENRGLSCGPAEVLARLAAGETVDPSSHYFRPAALFRTSAEAYGWLTESVFVGEGERYPDRVVVRFWRVE
jgi:hypothetical protein